jgi:predicted membrane protein
VFDKDLEGWINKASFYAGVRSSKLQLQSVLFFISWPLRVGPTTIYEINFVINILAPLVDHKLGIGTEGWVQLGLASLGWLICIQIFYFLFGLACRVQLALISNFFFHSMIRTYSS